MTGVVRCASWLLLLQSQASSIMKLLLSHIFMILIAILSSSGCQHIGPMTIMDDRIPYNEAISATWKQQTLLNLVRLRYGDLPEFVEVSSVVNGYEHGRTGNASAGAGISPNNTLLNALNLGVGGSSTMIDRPTISYKPQSSSEFTRNMTNPIPPVSILNLIESGAPADVLLALTVESINGVRNRGFSGEVQQGDPAFQQAIQTIRKAQDSGYASFRVLPGADPKTPDVLMGIRDQDIPSALAEELDQMRTLLRMDPDVHEFRIVFGMLPQKNDEIAFRTRNVFRIMNYLSLNVQVPASHLADGRAADFGDLSSSTEPPLTVYSGCEPPCDAYSAIQYQDHWFWIDQRDSNSKRSMGYLKILLALADTSQSDPTPALTIRAN
jgi:hypothetical protein